MHVTEISYASSIVQQTHKDNTMVNKLIKYASNYILIQMTKRNPTNQPTGTNIS